MEPLGRGGCQLLSFPEDLQAGATSLHDFRGSARPNAQNPRLTLQSLKLCMQDKDAPFTAGDHSCGGLGQDLFVRATGIEVFKGGLVL